MLWKPADEHGDFSRQLETLQKSVGTNAQTDIEYSDLLLTIPEDQVTSKSISPFPSNHPRGDRKGTG